MCDDTSHGETEASPALSQQVPSLTRKRGNKIPHRSYGWIFKAPTFEVMSMVRPRHEKLNRKKIAGLVALRAKCKNGEEI